MKKWMLGISVVLSMQSIVVFAEPLDGGAILKMEAEKARKIEDLEYQAKLVEQKAKLANAYKKLHESGGYVPGDNEGFSSAGGAVKTSGTQPSEDVHQLPKLKSISGQSALFEWKGNIFRGRPGSELPGGFVVLSVNANDGVRLKHAENIYGLDISWTK